MYKFKFKLKQARTLKGITQKRLAILSGFSQSHISELELGKESPTLKTIEDIAYALDTYPCNLLKVEK